MTSRTPQATTGSIAMATAVGPPVRASIAALRSSSPSRESRRGGTGSVLRVLRSDRDFLRERLRPLTNALGEILWLRNLEDPGAKDAPITDSAWPRISHPPGLCFTALVSVFELVAEPGGLFILLGICFFILSGDLKGLIRSRSIALCVSIRFRLSSLDLLMADLEALKVYANYFQDTFKIFVMPLPEVYDPEKVALYFSLRPHILAFRIAEVFLSWASFAIKLQTSKAFNVNKQSVNLNDGIDNSQYLAGKLVKESLLNLGPTFIKVGQSLSTRPDIIGSDVSKALSELHENVPPFPRTVALKVMEEEFECPIERIFSYISEEPVAAASFGQVYRGCTLDGTVVAIKVQRPNLLPSVARDIYILRLGLTLLRKMAKRKSDLRLYADELGRGVIGELDYTREAANVAAFSEVHSQYSFIKVPKVFMNLTSKRVLTMEWIVGENPNDLLAQAKEFGKENNRYPERKRLEAKVHLVDMVKKGVESTLIQLLETGLLHADPHPGNLRYTQEGHIGFLDFGLLCRMEKKHQLAMLSAIVHIVNGDWNALVYDLMEMDVGRPGTNLRRVAMFEVTFDDIDLEEALGEVVFINGIPDIKYSRLMPVGQIAPSHDSRSSPLNAGNTLANNRHMLYVFAGRFFFSTVTYMIILVHMDFSDRLAVAADPNFKTFQAAYNFVSTRLLYDNSAATRKILHSVVFNKRRELKWDRILLFLRLSNMRKNTSVVELEMLPSNRSSFGQTDKGEVFDTANLILRLLTSKDGAVFRRILMTADSTSLARTFISKDAKPLRRDLSSALADILFQWTSEAFRRNGVEERNKLNRNMILESEQMERKPASPSQLSVPLLQTVLRDKRLKVIFYKIANGVRQDSMLTVRVCWSLAAVLATAAVLAMHRALVYWSETHGRSFLPRRIALSIP
ncbi:hypothetical protein ZIOFF_065190 [Zingiber officinale]|uniref:Protein kinase domain-containing protein n=1 Tax=Zingiber officinale TaxID=94328 RepID=A0A8J5F1D5_ZINOF|nr:hypothetical protein ZIOFF_065190 [Zingiber officinale]